MLEPLPPSAAFRHTGAREGFEAVVFRTVPGGVLLEGGTAAVEDGVPWSVQYRIRADAAWRTTRVEATGVSPLGRSTLLAECLDGRWTVDGTERPDLDGCVDIDFESSLVTNTLAVHRLDLTARTPQQAPAAFVRADDLRVERMEQTYLPTAEPGRLDYASSTFGFAAVLTFDPAGVVTDYPGLGRRHS